MDRFEAVVAQSKASILIYGNPALDQFEFLELGTAEVETVEALVARGWLFAGIIGVDATGETKTALNIPFQHDVMTRICDAFVVRLKSQWFALDMERLFGLPDPRTVN